VIPSKKRFRGKEIVLHIEEPNFIYKLIWKFFMGVNQRPCVAVGGVFLAPSSHHLKEELVHCYKTTHLILTMNIVIYD